MLLQDEGATTNHFSSPHQTQNEGESDKINPYTNEKEKELYSFLFENNLLQLYDKLKELQLYISVLETINLNHKDFDNLCSENLGLNNNQVYIKLKFQKAIKQLQSELELREMPHAPMALPNNNINNIIQSYNPRPKNVKKAHIEPGAEFIYPSPYQPNKNDDNILDYIADIEAKIHNPVIITEIVNSAYRIMIFLRVILWIMDQFILQPSFPEKCILIGGNFGSFLLFIMSISGMYNICKNPLSKKSGSLSIIIASSELIYFVVRDGICFICYQTLFMINNDIINKNNQLNNFGIHAMISLILSVCLGRIIWQYRSEIFIQLHAAKWNIICNYVMFAWIVSWEYNTINQIAKTKNDNAKVLKITHLLSIFFCTENIFLMAAILLAPPIKQKKKQ